MRMRDYRLFSVSPQSWNLVPGNWPVERVFTSELEPGSWKLAIVERGLTGQRKNPSFEGAFKRLAWSQAVLCQLDNC